MERIRYDFPSLAYNRTFVHSISQPLRIPQDFLMESVTNGRARKFALAQYTPTLIRRFNQNWIGFRVKRHPPVPPARLDNAERSLLQRRALGYDVPFSSLPGSAAHRLPRHAARP